MDLAEVFMNEFKITEEYVYRYENVDLSLSIKNNNLVSECSQYYGPLESDWYSLGMRAKWLRVG
jgi:hypothetical protein